MAHHKACASVDPNVSSETFANAYRACRESGLTNYRLIKGSAIGHIRTETTPFGVTLFNVGDARRLAQLGARA